MAENKHGNPRPTTWRVQKVTATPGVTLAELIHVEWFKPNPEWQRLMDDETYDGDMPDQFIDAEPGEDGAEAYEPSAGRLTLDVTHGPDLKPNDNVTVTVALLPHG